MGMGPVRACNESINVTHSTHDLSTNCRLWVAGSNVSRYLSLECSPQRYHSQKACIFSFADIVHEDLKNIPKIKSSHVKPIPA